jgi:hypothetical protein
MAWQKKVMLRAAVPENLNLFIIEIQSPVIIKACAGDKSDLLFVASDRYSSTSVYD